MSKEGEGVCVDDDDDDDAVESEDVFVPGLNSPNVNSMGVEVPDLRALLYSIILKMLLGSLLDVMIVLTPAAVAISAAMSLVSIPPVPKCEPSVVVLTNSNLRLDSS